MPYISKERRKEFEALTDLIQVSPAATPGDLNYLITVLVKTFIRSQFPSYQSYNDALGALEGAKLELYRRKIASYEDLKISENGDV